MKTSAALIGACLFTWFPEASCPWAPGPKFRPGIVLDFDPNLNRLLVAYGTSQRTEENGRGEITFTKDEIVGLSKDTKFCFTNSRWLDAKPEYFIGSDGKPVVLGFIPSNRVTEFQLRLQEAGLI